MSRRKITRDFYDNLVAAFREHPDSYAAAARSAGCDQRTAKRGWQKGWLTIADWARPICEVVAEHEAKVMVAARAKRARIMQAEEEARLERERAEAEGYAVEAEAQKTAQAQNQAVQRVQARADVSDTRAQEGVVVALARGNAARYLGASQQMMAGLTALTKRIRAEMEELGTPEKVVNGKPIYKKANLGQMMRLVQTASSAMRQGNEAALIAMRMERLFMGEPEGTIGFRLESFEQAEGHLERANRALQRAKKLGLNVHRGGANAGGAADGTA